MRAKQIHRAFTLVELLVVIAILGILLAIFLPAVSAVREQARKSNCRNNLRQIGIALNSFEVANSKFPSFLDSDSTGQMAARSSHTGGVHVLMVDGSTRFVGDDIDSTAGQNGCGPEPHGVWQAMHTRAGGELLDD